YCFFFCFFFFSSRRRHTRLQGDWSSDVCSSDLLHFVCHEILVIERDRAGIVLKYRNAKIFLTFGFADLFGRALDIPAVDPLLHRSEERRVGKECSARWWAYH